VIYPQLFAKSGSAGKTVRAGVIGTGHFATPILAQSRSIAGLDVPVVADLACHESEGRRIPDRAGASPLRGGDAALAVATRAGRSFFPKA